jgi:hypothetical protein
MASPDTGSRWKYVYQPLKVDPPEMRLMTLLPGPFSSQIRATLSKVSFEDMTSYEAISYAWGDPSTTVPILLDGIEFPITVNLESALRHFRLEEKSRLLWADAVCINQLDIQERNIQVRFMGEIYKKCLRCLIWLGEADEDGDAAFDFIEELTGGGCVLPDGALGTPSTMHLIYPALSSWEIILKSLSRFMRRSWWDRMWVVQEAGLPPDVEYWCSRRMVNQEVLYVAWGSLNDIWSEAAGDSRCVKPQESRCVKPPWLRDEHIQRSLNGFLIRINPYELGRRKDNSWDGKWDLLTLMVICRTRSCTDPLDKVYALLGLATDEWLSSMVIDYGTTLRTLFTQVFLTDIQINKSFRSLGLVWSNDLNYHTLPSWLPSWETRQLEPLDYFSLLRYELYNASKSRLPQVEENSLTEGILKFRTILFDRADIVANPKLAAHNPDHDSERHSILEQWTDWFKAHGPLRCGGSPWSCPPCMSDISAERQTPDTTSYVAGGTAWNAFWRTMILDQCRSMVVGPTPQLFRVDATFEAPFWCVWFRSTTLCTTLSKDKTAASKVRYMQTEIQETTSIRKFFITKNSYFGMGPRNMQQGDEIHIVAGGNCPLVLRPVNNPQSPSTNPRYTLVGDCYLHGIMDGEAANNFEKRATMVEII